MHQSSLDKMAKFREVYLIDMESQDLKIIDLGSQDVSGTKTYKDVLYNNKWDYIGVDMIEGGNVDLVLDNPYHWKEIKSSCVDVIVSGQAFEHIEYFWITMLEISRVLRPGGLACIIAPSGGYEHRYPVDCWRFYPDGFSALSRFAQMDVLEVYTQWEPLGYEIDDSDGWKDTVLVCRKPDFPFYIGLKSKVKKYLLHRALMMGVS